MCAVNTSIFQQDSALSSHAHETIQLLRYMSSGFITPDLWPTNSTDQTLTQLTTIFGMLCSNACKTYQKLLKLTGQCLTSYHAAAYKWGVF